MICRSLANASYWLKIYFALEKNLKVLVNKGILQMYTHGALQKPSYYSPTSETNEQGELADFINKLMLGEFDNCGDDIGKIEKLVQMQEKFYVVYGKALETNTLRQDLREAYKKIAELVEVNKEKTEYIKNLEEKIDKLEENKNELEGIASNKFKEINEEQKKFKDRRDAEFYELLSKMELNNTLLTVGASTGGFVAGGAAPAAIIIGASFGLAAPTGGLSALLLLTLPLVPVTGVITALKIEDERNFSWNRYYSRAKSEFESYIAEHPLATALEAKEHVVRVLSKK